MGRRDSCFCGTITTPSTIASARPAEHLMSTTPISTPIRVPVWQVAKESYRSVFGQPIVFIKLAWFPALLIFLIAGTFFYFFFKKAPELLSILGTEGTSQEISRALRWFDLQSLFGAIVLIALVDVFAVRWHRYRLLGETTGGMAEMFNREWRRFTAYALLISSPSLASLLWHIVVEFFPGIDQPFNGVIGGILEATLSLLRTGFFVCAFGCSLIFPAAAYGQPITWHQAWRYLRGNFWRLAGCCLVAGILTFLTCLPVMLLLMVPTPAVGALGEFAMTGILTVFELIFVALLASILSNFYRRIVLVKQTT
jgi:hypothetical protein